MLSPRLLALLSLAVSLFSAGLGLVQAPTGLPADGPEYLLMSEAFLDHGAPNITDRQYRDIRAYLPNGKEIHAAMQPFRLDASPPFFKDADGNYYSDHFWLYPLLATPFLFLVKMLALPMSWAFVWLNLALAFVAAYAIYGNDGLAPLPRLLQLVLFWSCGTIPYLGWAHPEVFTASMLVFALISASRKCYGLAALSAALAAQQNPPAIFLAAIFLLVDFYKHVVGKRLLLPSRPRGAFWAGCVILSGWASMFFWLHFGHYNLIVYSGWARASLISLQRLFSFYFDLNQGMIILLWILIPFVPVLLVLNFWRRGKTCWPDVLRFGLLCVGSVILAVPALSTANWNSGSSFVMRYVYWASTPIVFSLSYLFFDDRCVKRIFVCMIGALLLQNFAYSKIPDRYWSGSYTPWALFAFDHMPWIYNPVPEIFVERGAHIEGFDGTGVHLYSYHGNIRKVLLDTSKNNISAVACANGEPASKYVASTSDVGSEWRYYNLSRGCGYSVSEGYAQYHAPVSRTAPAVTEVRRAVML